MKFAWQGWPSIYNEGSYWYKCRAWHSVETPRLLQCYCCLQACGGKDNIRLHFRIFCNRYFFPFKKDLGKKPAKEALKGLLSVFKPAAVTDSHIYHAFDLEWDDFEDSIQYIVGESFSADYIITRNTQDFLSGSIPAVTPEEFLQTITTV